MTQGVTVEKVSPMVHEGIYVYKYGKVVSIICITGTPITATVDSTICTIPIGFRPPAPVHVWDALANARLYIDVDGNFSTKTAINNINLRCTFTYIVD